MDRLQDIRMAMQNKKEKRTSKLRFTSYLVSVVSILLAIFIFLAPGWLMSVTQPFLQFIVYEDLTAAMLFIPGVLEIAGMHAGVEKFRHFGVYALSFTWGGLFLVSLVYSFGIGYPDPWFIFTGAILALCWHVALRSDI